MVESYKGHYSYGGCQHWRWRVRVGRFTVLCSSLFWSDRSDSKGVEPDFGIYLYSGWRDKLGKIWTNGAYIKSVAEQRPYPALVIDWPDLQAVSTQQLTQLVNICLSKMRHGKLIDIGCHAGHGRTGTLLACLIARVEHISAKEAIKAVHDRYCHLAVENHAQQEAVETYVRTVPWSKRPVNPPRAHRLLMRRMQTFIHKLEI